MLANAKINLCLQITGKRSDGFHLLQSLVMFARVGDELTLSVNEEFVMNVTGPYSSSLVGEPVAENLVARAAGKLAEQNNKPLHIAFDLQKNLPIGAGLGGGSADAAAALHLLNEYWELGCSGQDLSSIGITLGSDIPTCIYNQPAWMEGTGERIIPCAIGFDIPILLVNPGVYVATKDVYERCKVPYAEPMPLPSRFSSYDALCGFLQQTQNHLQDAAISVAPSIQTTLVTLEEQPGCRLARMSGSGATCFALFDSDEEMQAAAQIVRGKHPDYWVQATQLIGTQHGKTS